MMMMHSNNREEIDEAYAGDIIALAGLKDTTTGDTICDTVKPVVLETMTFPDPVIEIAVEPKTKNDQEKMSAGLQRLAAEDPSFRVETDLESGQTIMKGMGELHLDILVDRLKREFKVEANIGAPQVAYRETVSNEAENDYTTFISRIRKDNSNIKAINLWVVSDNLLKGAALNTVQIAECLMKKI